MPIFNHLVTSQESRTCQVFVVSISNHMIYGGLDSLNCGNTCFDYIQIVVEVAGEKVIVVIADALVAV